MNEAQRREESGDEGANLTGLLCLFEGDDPIVEVFCEQPDNIFICAVIGAVDITQLQRIEDEIKACAEFNCGEGIYCFKCSYQPPEYDGETYGLIQSDDWHCEQIKYVPFGA